MGIGGDSGSLLLLISVPGSIACTAGDERDGHDTGDHQIAALGRHLAMADLGLACRGNGRQGYIAHGDGLVHGWCGTQARKLASQRILAGKLSSKTVSSPVSDSGWLPASLSVPS